MLLQFRCSNFGPFKDETIFDMRATDSDGLDFKVVKLNKSTRVLTTSAIYGANFGGKTEFCDAFGFMCDYVLNSLSYAGESETNDYGFNKASTFMGDEKYRYEDSEFEVYFTVPSGETYQYGFCLRNKVGVTDEWLSVKARTGKTYKKIFRREGSVDEYTNRYKFKLDLNGVPNKSKPALVTMLSREALVVSLGPEMKLDTCETVKNWFADNRYVHQRYFDNNKISINELPDGFTTDNNVREDVIKFLNHFGEKNICWFSFEKDPTDETLYDVYTIYNIENSNDKRGIKINSGHSGLRKLFMLYKPIKEVLDSGGVLVVDDLDANLHTLITRNIIQMFFKEETNKKHAQLIFTTHDTWFLCNVMFRTDEVWFVEKKDDGASSLYSLADFKKTDKKDSDIINKYTADKYMTGCFGAIPIFEDGEEEEACSD